MRGPTPPRPAGGAPTPATPPTQPAARAWQQVVQLTIPATKAGSLAKGVDAVALLEQACLAEVSADRSSHPCPWWSLFQACDKSASAKGCPRCATQKIFHKSVISAVKAAAADTWRAKITGPPSQPNPRPGL